MVAPFVKIAKLSHCSSEKITTKELVVMGHIFALSSVFFWSALYVCVKVLLESFSPFELLILQFALGYVILLFYRPKYLRLPLQDELRIACAGLCGISIYNLFLNLAMEQTAVSNVSIIIATAPLFTGIFSFILQIEKPYANFFLGFVLCISGVVLLSEGFSINPVGDVLALISAVGWGAYSVLIVRILGKHYDLVLVTRRMIFYGIVFLLPGFLVFDFRPNLAALGDPKVSLNLVLVALFASGLCFILWNRATTLIGAIKTNIYVYLTPIITIFVAMILLDERIGFWGVAGVALTLLGIALSEWRKGT